MQAFVSEYEEKLDELCDKCKQMKQIYNKVLVSQLAKVSNVEMCYWIKREN